jgi:AbrB family looped-hinge helix DNA binding protein
MKIAQSRLTSQGQISVPAEVRKRLQLVPGEAIEWEELESGDIVVRPASKLTWQQVRDRLAKLGPRPPRRPAVTIGEMKSAAAAGASERYARSVDRMRGKTRDKTIGKRK